MMDMIAAIMRIGANEIKDFCLEYFPTTKAATFMEESCGIADIITSSMILCFLSHLNTNDGWSF